MKHLPLLFFYFLLGFCFQFPSIAMRYWMMDWVTPAQMAAIFGIVSIPWCLKPLYGFISDSYPVLGYRRRPYMTMGALLSSFMWIILPFCPHDEFIVTLVMTLSSLGLCFADVMADSLLVEIARSESEANKGVIQSYSWMLRFAGGLSASIFGALAYDKLGHVQVFHLNSMIPVTIALLSLCIHETDSSTSVNWRITRSKLTAAVRQPTVHRPALFLFLICVTPGYGSVLTFFYQKELQFTPDEFGTLDVLGHVVAIFGTFIYKKYLRDVPFRTIFKWALILSFVLENTLLLLVLHTNRTIGIPDFVFALIERIVITLVGQFITMPMVVLGARVCPVGVEGTLYALLMSITNIGGVVSSEWGSLLTSMFGITGTNFTNLWKLMLVCHAFDLIPLLGLRLLQ
jgi:folate/biopterin transporter|tara:strand:+ start:8531 stop:9733 length:1203 start_codon:yes stop_codon:yes gene_type:complete